MNAREHLKCGYGRSSGQRGLDVVESLGCSRIIVESDSLEAIQACEGSIEIWSPYTATPRGGARASRS